ncbi:MAG: hypothetical protein KGD64_15255, partial [Candidatus Heimdallarchaeota archaeon]|nr:hypothetical protein [Candidatus Heimdallarchaeota archaeon]
LEGNYWDDYIGAGSYSIAGLAGASDPYPLDEFMNPPVFSEPTNNTNMPILVFTLGLATIPISLIIRKRLKNR